MAGAIALACVLASTPALGEPRLTQQQSNPKPIAPLTLSYGSQPPVSSFLIPAELAAIRATWEPPAPAPPFLLKVTAGASVTAPPYVPPATPHAIELAAWATVWQPSPVSLDIAALLAIPGTQVPSLLSQLAQGLAAIPPWQQPPALVTIAGRLAIPGTQVPALLVQPQAAALWQAPPTLVSVASLIPAPVAAGVTYTRVSVPASLDLPTAVVRITVPIPTSASLAWGPVAPRVPLWWSDASPTLALPRVAALIPAPVVTAWIASARPGQLVALEAPRVQVPGLVAAIVPPPVVSVFIASAKPGTPATPATVPDGLVVRVPSMVATLPAPIVSPVVAFTRTRVPVALEWIAPSTLRVVTQGSAPGQPPYTRVLIIGATHTPLEQRALGGASGIASLISAPVAPDLALLGTFVQLVVPALVALATPSVTVALLVIGATVALATPDVAAALTSPNQRIIPAPPQTSRPEP